MKNFSSIASAPLFPNGGEKKRDIKIVVLSTKYSRGPQKESVAAPRETGDDGGGAEWLRRGRGGARGEEDSSDHSSSDRAAAGVMTVVVLRSDGGRDNHSGCDEEHMAGAYIYWALAMSQVVCSTLSFHYLI